MSLIQRENKVAIRKGSTWGSAVEPDASNGMGLFVKAHTPPKGARKVVTNEDEFGRVMASSAEVLEYEGQSGSMSLRFYWEGLEEIAASLMGIYSTSAPEAGVVRHKCTLATGMNSIFHTVAWDEGSQVKAVNSARIVSGTFSYQDGLNLDINYLGDKVEVPSGWSVPLDAGLSYPSDGFGVFKLSNATVEINAEGTTDFDAGGADKLYPSGIDIAITRGFEGLAATAGSDAISEPVEKAAPNIEITLSFPKKETETAAYFDAFNNRDFKKMRIKFEADDIPGAATSKYEIQFDFPKVAVMEAPDFAQDTPIPTTIKLKGLKASSAPSPVMDEAVPYISIQNKRAALTGYPSS
jgi:hypothetical protein